LFVIGVILVAPDDLENSLLSIDVNQILLSFRQLIRVNLHDSSSFFLFFGSLLPQPLGKEVIECCQDFNILLEKRVVL